MGSEERTRLKTLLGYWIEHNREHSEEFGEWANRARAMGEAEVSEAISQAVMEIDRANKLLTQARKKLEE